MEPTTFFAAASRRVTLGSPTKQSTTGNICVPIRMPLTAESLASAPDWVTVAYEQVSDSAKEFIPALEEIADIVVTFDNSKPKGKLFEDPNAKVPSASLKGFVVQRCGDEENPDVELIFKLYAPFSRDFWRWLGEMATPKNEVYMGFPKSLGKSIAIVKPEDQAQEALDLATAEASETEKEAFSSDANPPKDPPKAKGGKSGPKELKAYHDNLASKGAKR